MSLFFQVGVNGSRGWRKKIFEVSVEHTIIEDSTWGCLSENGGLLFVILQRLSQGVGQQQRGGPHLLRALHVELLEQVLVDLSLGTSLEHSLNYLVKLVLEIDW